MASQELHDYVLTSYIFKISLIPQVIYKSVHFIFFFLIPKEEVSSDEQRLPHGRRSLGCDQQSGQVVWDDHHLTGPHWN